ncbi:hypothetical protein ALP84_05248 [Pseudomonas cichorii]|uniref:Uncharacterized protein n=1 Tax=Pseudomonas cichorii TaxID=36746 RepID=A0A3M4VIQ5_PSECI|nr:hypothetical protein ALP84_05248 [Pseudomonas cichorii]
MYAITAGATGSAAVVQLVFQWVYESTYLDFFFAFQLDVSVDEVVAENAAFGQERTTFVQLFQGFFQAAANLWNAFGLFWRQVIQVFVSCIARVDLVLDAVQASHQQCGERQVRVGCRIREAGFDTTAAWAGDVRNTDRGGTVTSRVGQHDRSFETWDQTLVGVGRRVGEAVQGLTMLDDTADEVQGGVGQAGIAFAREGVLAIFGDGHVNVHTRTVIAVQRLGHEGSGATVSVGNVVHDILEGLNFVSLGNQGVELHADFVLAGSCHFVVVNFDDLTHFFQCVAHGSTDFVVVVDRWNREVAAFDTWTVAFVAAFHVLVRHPRALFGEDLEHGAGDVGLVLDRIEDEEFWLRTNEYGVTDTGGLQVFLGAVGDGAWVAVIALHGRRFDDVADQDQGRLFGERVQNCGAVVRQQDHVGGFDTFPAFNGGTVEHLADFKEVVVQRIASWHGDVLLLAFGVSEAQINPFNVMIFDELNRLRHGVLRVARAWLWLWPLKFG